MAIYELNIGGGVTDIITGDIQVDYDQNLVSGGLSLTLLGQTVPISSLTLVSDGVGGYTITGTVLPSSVPLGSSLANTAITLNYANLNPTTVAAAAAVPVIGTTTQTEAVLSAAVCYASGTLIRTVRGDVPVETLAAGDLVVTAAGAHRPIRWIGHRRTVCRNYAAPQAAWPVRIGADAIGPGRPLRDLYVSPGHAICIDVVGEVLIPAINLVNGTTIAQVEVDEVTYWHVELDSHDLLVAEGLAAESYCEMDNRAFFVEADAVSLQASPDAARPTHADFCRPFFEQGPLVQVVRDRLRANALALGWSLSHAPLGGLRIVADGAVVQPVADGLTARFLLPADAEDVWLVSGTSVPAEVCDSTDVRMLGVDLRGLTIDDGLGQPRRIALTDPLLCVGFHEPEDAGTRRQTAGRARLPAALWAGCRETFFLRVDLAGPALPRWIAPEPAAADKPRLTLVAAA